jgi:hypothetical protein
MTFNQEFIERKLTEHAKFMEHCAEYQARVIRSEIVADYLRKIRERQ